MEGLLKYNGEKWMVKFFDQGEKELPLHYKDNEMIESVFDHGVEQIVEFEIIDEFSHPNLFLGIPWGFGDYCVKLK